MNVIIGTDYKSVLMTTFKAFLDFCDLYHLEYCVCAGTCIGAVRHHGLIPWDDDIDVFMKRSELNRLISLRNRFPDGYKLILMGESGYPYPIPKFYNTNTTLWEDKSIKTIIGVYVDIFPLDECIEDVNYCLNLKRQYEKAYFNYIDSYRNWEFEDLYQKIVNFHPLGAFRIIKNVCINKNLKPLYQKRFNRLYSLITSMSGPNVTGFDGLFATIYPGNWLSSTVEMDFEGLMVKVPKDYDLYLRATYGDYMTPPPIEKRKSTHSHYYLNLHERLTLEQIKEIKKQERHQ